MRNNGSPKFRKIIAAIMTICMVTGLCCIPQSGTNIYAAEQKTAGEAPDWAVFETDFSKLVSSGDAMPEYHMEQRARNGLPAELKTTHWFFCAIRKTAIRKQTLERQ